MNIMEDCEIKREEDVALRRAAMLNVDASGLKGKSVPALVKLFKAIDALNADRETAIREMARYKINPSTLARYGMPRPTTNSNPVFRAIVDHFEEEQDNQEVTISQTKYEAMQYELEMLREQNKNLISLGLQVQYLQKEVEQQKSRRIQAEDAYYKLHKQYEPNQPDELLVDLSLAPTERS